MKFRVFGEWFLLVAGFFGGHTAQHGLWHDTLLFLIFALAPVGVLELVRALIRENWPGLRVTYNKKEQK